jgi:hypothetical protein
VLALQVIVNAQAIAQSLQSQEKIVDGELASIDCFTLNAFIGFVSAVQVSASH